MAVTNSTDASQSRWTGVIHRQPIDIVLGDLWEGHVASKGIKVREFWAVAKALEALPSDIRDCRVNFQVDNQAVIHTWVGRGGRAKNMYPVAKKIFQFDTGTEPPINYVLSSFGVQPCRRVLSEIKCYGLHAGTSMLG